MQKKYLFFLVVIFNIIISGCSKSNIIVDHLAEAQLTKSNELQFKFMINDFILENNEAYKIKVIINDNVLASALGKREFIYGEDFIRDGRTVQVKGNIEADKGHYFLMEPIPLLKDLHTYELRELITQKQAVSILVYSKDKVIGKDYLTNFSTLL